MKASKSLRVGIVGCGRVAQRWHIPPLLKMKDVRIAAVCDMNEDLAKRTAKSFRINRYYADLSQMLERENLDMVDICTSPKTHATLSVMVMEASCDVLVEKLFAMSTKEADEIIRASEENKVKLCVAHNKLFQPMVMRATSMTNLGAIGHLTGIDIVDAWPKENVDFMNKDHWYHKLPGGVLGEILPHPIYLAMSFLGKLEPVAVYARKLCSYEWVAADELRVILEGKRGTGMLTASCNWPKGGSTLDVLGTEKNLHIDLQTGVLTKFGTGGESRPWRALDNLSQGYQLFTCTTSAALNTLLGRQHSGHHTLIQKFVESIINDTEPPVTGEEGKEVVRVLERITAQMTSGPGSD